MVLVIRNLFAEVMRLFRRSNLTEMRPPSIFHITLLAVKAHNEKESGKQELPFKSMFTLANMPCVRNGLDTRGRPLRRKHRVPPTPQN